AWAPEVAIPVPVAAIVAVGDEVVGAAAVPQPASMGTSASSRTPTAMTCRRIFAFSFASSLLIQLSGRCALTDHSWQGQCQAAAEWIPRARTSPCLSSALRIGQFNGDAAHNVGDNIVDEREDRAGHGTDKHSEQNRDKQGNQANAYEEDGMNEPPEH